MNFLLAILVLAISAPVSFIQGKSQVQASTKPALPTIFSHVLQQARNSGLPLLLPSELPYYVNPRDVHNVSVDPQDSGYSITLHFKYGCGDECFVGSFSATRIPFSKPEGARDVALDSGVTGYYVAKGCRGGCPPPEIYFVVDKITYRIKFAPDEASPADSEAALIMLANSSLKAGPR